MKAGFHGEEDLDRIVRRKKAEIATVGYCFWGYGGNLCHPTRAIHPFLDTIPHKAIPVLFIPTPSPFFSSGVPATEYSVDGRAWQPIPSGISVLASSKALILDSLNLVNATVDSSRYEISFGPSTGRSLTSYLQKRVDKAMATRVNDFIDRIPSLLKIGIVGILAEPYAVMIR